MMKPQVSLSTVVAVAVLLCSVFFLLAQIAVAAPATLSTGVDWRQAQQPNAAPDLTVDRIMLTPASPGAGQTADITPIIKNIGDAAAGGFSIHLYIDPIDNPPIPTTPVTAL